MASFFKMTQTIKTHKVEYEYILNVIMLRTLVDFHYIKAASSAFIWE